MILRRQWNWLLLLLVNADGIVDIFKIEEPVIWHPIFDEIKEVY